MVSVLDDKLTGLIAEELGISKDKVTPALIQRLRDEEPIENFEFDTKYGGYIPPARTVPTKAELEANRTRARAFWRKRSATATH